jgi:hypothetical protein
VREKSGKAEWARLWTPSLMHRFFRISLRILLIESDGHGLGLQILLHPLRSQFSSMARLFETTEWGLKI